MNPSTIYQPLTVRTLEKESYYAALSVKTSARSDNRVVNLWKLATNRLSELATIITSQGSYIRKSHANLQGKLFCAFLLPYFSCWLTKNYRKLDGCEVVFS